MGFNFNIFLACTHGGHEDVVHRRYDLLEGAEINGTVDGGYHVALAGAGCEREGGGEIAELVGLADHCLRAETVGSLKELRRVTLIGDAVAVVGKFLAHVAHGTRQDVARAVYERDVVAQFLHATHVVGREDDGGAFVAQFQNLALEDSGVDGVETGERLVEDEQFRTVKHRDDKLDLLGHTFRQFLDLLVPPVGDLKTVEPFAQARGCLGLGETFQAGEEECLLADFHLLVETALLGELADVGHVVGGEWVAVEGDETRVGGGDVVDDADKGGLARAVGAEQSVDLSAWHAYRHIVERAVVGETFRYMFRRQYIIHCNRC